MAIAVNFGRPKAAFVESAHSLTFGDLGMEAYAFGTQAATIATTKMPPLHLS